MRTRLALFASLILALAGAAHAADGDLDADFGTDAEFPGLGFYPSPYGAPLSSRVLALAPAPDGHLYLVGTVEDGPDSYRIGVMRTDADGYPDFAFGDAGLRTFPPPCADAFAADAAVDRQGRLWIAFGRCADFTAYRLTPAGELDTGLLGTGVLTVAFDLGGDDVDDSRRIAFAPNGDVVLAGPVAASPVRHLGVARYTADGAPAPGFGSDGKADLPADGLFNYWQGLHVMADGRIVVTGKFTPNPAVVRQTVVRLQANGTPDFGFGNYAPGIGHVDIAALTGHANNPLNTFGSLLEADGSILQVGSAAYGDPLAGQDFALLKWRPDGQLDTGIGAFGLRRYGLDFAGPAPDEASENSDIAQAIARQSDGKYVIVGTSRAADHRSGLSLLRLTRTLEPDPNFGDGGKRRIAPEIGAGGANCISAADVRVRPGRIVAAMNACAGPGGWTMQAMAGLRNDLLFANGFD